MRSMSDYNKSQKTGCSCSLTGMLFLIALTAATIMMVKECQRSDIRLKKDREAYEKMHDTIQKQISDTTITKFKK